MSPSPSLPPPPQALHSPPITIVLTVILLVFFLLGFFSIYFCRCIMEAVFHTWHFRRTLSGHLAAGVNPAQSGLDRAVIKSLPTFLYSSVKEVRKEKYALECAICLAEFNDDSFLRLLTVCYHVFHQDCIDLWLESHKTCPVCRRDLDTPHLFAAKSPDNNNRPSPAADTRRNDLSSPEDNAVRIDIDVNNDERNDDVLEAVRRRTRRRRRCDRSCRVRSTDERPGLAGDAERFTRSHSTGHSIVRPREDDEDEDEDGDKGEGGERGEEDRYTLRLPEHVRLRILRARHWTASCEAYKWDHLVARHRFYVSSDYGSPASYDNSGALVADHPSDQSHHHHHHHHHHHTTVL